MSTLPATTPRLTQTGNDPTTGATYTAAQLSATITKQLDQVPGCPVDYLDKLKQHYAAPGRHPKADSFRQNWGKTMDAYLDTPLKDVLYHISQNVAEHVPATASKSTFQKTITKRLNYVPFDFIKKRQPRLHTPQPVDAPVAADPKTLKSAREQLLAAAQCSLMTEPEDTCAKMREQMLQRDFDYKPGEKTPDGVAMPNPIYSLPTSSNIQKVGAIHNQVTLFNSPIFRINNSLQEDHFQQKQEELKITGSPPKTHEPLEVFQGTSYWSTANIIGQDGRFYMGDEVQKTGRTLGYGSYWGTKIGKVMNYIGNSSYSSRPGNVASTQNVTKNECNGIMFMSTIMRGNNYSTMGAKDANKKHLTSLSIDANPYYDSTQKGARDFEICVRDNDLISPHHIVDISVRTLGYNIYKCPEGYRDMTTGRLLYDTQGVALGIQYNEESD